MQDEIAVNACVTDIRHSNLYEMLLLVSYTTDGNNNLYCSHTYPARHLFISNKLHKSCDRSIAVHSVPHQHFGQM